MNKPFVINLIGGPGCGKSTTMAGVFYELKKLGINCEMAPEYAKDKVWEESFHIMDDQLYVFGKQMHRVWRLLDKVDIIIMDTSLLSSIIYDKTHSQALEQLCVEQFKKFNNHVFFIERGEEYQESGRRESFDISKQIDNQYKDLMNKYAIPYFDVKNVDAVDFILKFIKDNYSELWEKEKKTL